MSKKSSNWIVKYDSVEKTNMGEKQPKKGNKKSALTKIFINSKVKNLGYEKAVTVHYRDSASDTWHDREAHFDHVINEQEEIWREVASFKGEYIEYAIKYEVGGNTYWDNNDGKNYKTYRDGRTI